VNDGIESALRQARAAAGGRDIRIGGGAQTVQQYLRAGLVDEFHVALSPVFLGAGLRLFDQIPSTDRLVPRDAPRSSRVTHLVYAVERAANAAGRVAEHAGGQQ
jgi:dihydrofolate reductase